MCRRGESGTTVTRSPTAAATSASVPGVGLAPAAENSRRITAGSAPVVRASATFYLPRPASHLPQRVLTDDVSSARFAWLTGSRVAPGGLRPRGHRRAGVLLPRPGRPPPRPGPGSAPPPPPRGALL